MYVFIVPTIFENLSLEYIHIFKKDKKLITTRPS